MQPPSVFEILYGGQRGGGKTDAGMVWIGHRRYTDTFGSDRPVYTHPRYRGLVIRKNADDLSDWVERFRFMYAGLGATVGYRPYEIRFPSGAFLRTGHLKDDQAYTKYMGHEYQSTLIEELTQIPFEKWFLQLISSSRSTIPELKAQVFSTTNPGGRGHGWVKKRYVDPAPPSTVFTDEEGINKIFIPAGVEDNPVLIKNDPAYVKRLDAIKHVDQDLYKAWRLGSWDVFAGQAFREFSYDKHVIDGVHNKIEFSLDICDKIICFDWGYRDKAVATWLALTPENKFGFRRVYMYREIVRTETDPETWAAIIKRFTDVEKVKFMVLPHDCFAHKESKVTIAQIFARDIGINIHRGDTLAKGARLGRKAILHRYLADAEDGQPYLLIHPSCRDFITTVPELQYDERNVEDIDCFVAGTQVLTTTGYKNVEDISIGEMMVTPIGDRPVIHSGVSGESERVIEVELSNGRMLRGTANHKVFVHSKGLVELQNLESTDVLGVRNNTKLWQTNWLNTKVLPIFAKRVMDTTILKSSLHCIGKYMSIITERLRNAGIFTTEILTTITTSPITLSQCHHTTMLSFTSSAIMRTKSSKQNTTTGIIQKKAKKYYQKMPTKCFTGQHTDDLSANIVESLLSRKRLIRYFAQKLVNTKLGLQNSPKRSARYATKFIKHLINGLGLVHINVVGSYGAEQVYRLTVAEAHLYYANGILVTNTTGDDHSYDASTLGLISIGYAPVNSKILQPPHKVVQTFPTWNTNEFGNVVPPNFWVEMERRRSIKPRDSEYL